MCFGQRTREEDRSSVDVSTEGCRDRVKDVSWCIILHSGYLIARDRTSLAKVVGAGTILSSPLVPQGGTGVTAAFIDNPVALTLHFKNSNYDKSKWSAQINNLSRDEIFESQGPLHNTYTIIQRCPRLMRPSMRSL